jgi:Peroxiredoxin
MKIEVGQPAPDFTLYTSDKKQVTLSAQRGQAVLLLFFPLAFYQYLYQGIMRCSRFDQLVRKCTGQSLWYFCGCIAYPGPV